VSEELILRERESGGKINQKIELGCAMFVDISAYSNKV
jgi:hypothetical protein